MKITLDNKNAIVCGSTQGIGEATAIVLAKLGANMTLIARNEKKLKKVLSSLDTTIGQSHNYLCVDFCSQVSSGTYIREISKQLGILCNLNTIIFNIYREKIILL